MSALDKLLYRLASVSIGGTVIPVPNPTATQTSPTPPTNLNFINATGAYNPTTGSYDITPLAFVANVVLPPYNAKGDGVHNDTAAIQSAIAAVVAHGGGTVLFPPGKYLVSPNSLVIPAPGGIAFLGEVGQAQNSTNTGYSGANILCNAVGTILSGPTDLSSTSTANSFDNRIEDLTFSWTTAARSSTGCKGIDFSGLNRTVFSRLVVVTPKGTTNAYCYYGTTYGAGGVAQGTYYNTFFHCNGSADENGASGHSVSGTKGHYWAYRTNDGGGVNANTVLGGTFHCCEITLELSNGYGNRVVGLMSEVPWVNHVRINGVSGGAKGFNVNIAYAEGTACHGVQFGNSDIPLENANGNVVSFDYWQRNPPDSDDYSNLISPVPGLVHPKTIWNDNIVELGGKRYTQPWNTQGSACAGPIGMEGGHGTQKLPFMFQTSGLAVADLELRVNKLIDHMQQHGLMDPMGPPAEDLQFNCIAWWRADHGITNRWRGTTPATWKDLISNQLVTSADTPQYQWGDTTGGGASTTIPSGAPTPQPWMYFPPSHSSYFLGTLSSAITTQAVTIYVFVYEATDQSTQGWVELTPAGVVDTGVEMYWDLANGNSAKKLTTKVSTTHERGTWHLWTGVFDGTGTKLYVDGVLDNSNSDTTAVPASLSTVCIGARGGGTQQFLNGGIAEVVIFQSAHTAPGIAAVASYYKNRYGIGY